MKQTPELTPTESLEQVPQANPHDMARTHQGADPSELFGPEVGVVCDQFVGYSRESFTGYSRAPISKSHADKLKDKDGPMYHPRSVDAFPGSSSFRFMSGYNGRGYVVGKYGDPNLARESDDLLVLCEDGRLRSISVYSAGAAIPEHKPYKDSKTPRMKRFVGKAGTSNAIENSSEVDESREFHFGSLTTDIHDGLRLLRVGPSDSPEKQITAALSSSSGRKFHEIKEIDDDRVLDSEGNPLSREEHQAMIQYYQDLHNADYARRHPKKAAREEEHPRSDEPRRERNHSDETPETASKDPIMFGLDFLSGKTRPDDEHNQVFPVMSVESFVNAFEKRHYDPEVARRLYLDLQQEGVIDDFHTPRQGYIVHPEKLAEIRELLGIEGNSSDTKAEDSSEDNGHKPVEELTNEEIIEMEDAAHRAYLDQFMAGSFEGLNEEEIVNLAKKIRKEAHEAYLGRKLSDVEELVIRYMVSELDEELAETKKASEERADSKDPGPTGGKDIFENKAGEDKNE